jgi:hypothetical protein
MCTLRLYVLHIGDGRDAEVIRASKDVLLRGPIFAHDNITKKIRIAMLRRCDYTKVCEDERGGGVGTSRTVVHIRDLCGGFFGVVSSSSAVPSASGAKRHIPAFLFGNEYSLAYLQSISIFASLICISLCCADGCLARY